MSRRTMMSVFVGCLLGAALSSGCKPTSSVYQFKIGNGQPVSNAPSGTAHPLVVTVETVVAEIPIPFTKLPGQLYRIDPATGQAIQVTTNRPRKILITR